MILLGVNSTKPFYLCQVPIDKSQKRPLGFESKALLSCVDYYTSLQKTGFGLLLGLMETE